MRVAELAQDDRPRERLLEKGPETLTDAELVAVLLRTGTRGTDVLELAERWLAEAGGLEGLAASDRRSLLKPNGVGPAKASIIAAALELGRRLARLSLVRGPILDRPEVVADYLARSFGAARVEKFGVITLDARNRLIRVHELHTGGRTHAEVEPSQIFHNAILDNAHAVILWHTHPSGDPSPSEDDVALTRRLADAGRLLNISVLDHVVATRSGFVSMRQRGLLQPR
ncbi:MAG: DNA repair protein RadC [Acidobacteriia bacterium]|nr:DNA repair protein RadC [Terriglobia bacterium]